MPELTTLVAALGYAGIAGAVFAETGLWVGFFLPGDSLLVTAGILASQGIFDIRILVAFTTIAAVVGDSVGYWSGTKAGPMIFTKPDSFWFNAERVKDAERFFERYGALSVILARFVPVVRTFVPVVAGVARMRYGTFFSFNVIGAVLWAFLIPVIGYYAGAAIPNIDKYIFPIVGVVIAASLIPLFVQLLKHGKRG